MKSRYIDSTGNEIRRSTYESFLAKNILENAGYWRDFFDELNKLIVEVITYNLNKNNYEFKYELDSFLKNFNMIYPETSLDKLIDHLSTPIAEKKDDYPNRFGFNIYKYFFERVLPSAWIIPQSHLLEDKEDNQDHRQTYYAATVGKSDLVRPSHLFSYQGRGRIGYAGAPTVTANAGILSEGGTPQEMKNKFKPPIPAGRLPYKRLPGSSTVQFFEMHDLPFGAGPSGTIGFTLNGVNALLNSKLKSKDFKKLYMALTAYLVYEGHHSFSDVGIVIDALKQHEPTAFEINPKLHPKAYYDQYLTLEYRVSNAYNKFCQIRNIAKYSAITWEIVKDAKEEQKKVTHSLQKSSDVFYADLTHFVDENFQKTGELSPDELDKLKIILKKHFPKPEEIKEIKSHEKASVATKLIQKLVDSGILIHPKTIIDWITVRRILDDFPSDEKNDSAINELHNFNKANADRKSELNDHDLAQLVKILVKVNIQETKENSGQEHILKEFQRILAGSGIQFTNLNEKDAQGFTPAMHSVLQNYKNLTKVLLDAKADPSITTQEGYTLLHLVCMQQNIPMLDAVLPYLPFKINEKSNQGDTPLLLAIQKNHSKLVASLLIHNADVNIGNSLGETPLLIAARNGNETLVTTLLEKKADPHVCLTRGTSILGISLKNGHKNIAEKILMAGVNIDQPNPDGLTLLWEAVDNRDETLVNTLLEFKANPNIINKNTKQNLLEYSIKYLSDKINEQLAKRIDINLEDSQGNSPLILATMHDKISLIKILLASKADLHAFNNEGMTALHLAAIKMNENLIDVFLNTNADINMPNQEGETPLMLMVKHNANYYTHYNEKLIKKMLEGKADPNLKDKKGLTALQYAISSDDPKLISLLINYNAVVSQVDVSESKLSLDFSSGKGTNENRVMQKK